MAYTAKDRADHVTDGTWRADRHASLTSNTVADESEDHRIWNMIAHWESVFTQGQEAVAAEGAIVQSATQRVPNPGAKIMKEASAELRELYKLVGIGALNRARLGVSDAEEAYGDADDVLPPLPVRKDG